MVLAAAPQVSKSTVQSWSINVRVEPGLTVLVSATRGSSTPLWARCEPVDALRHLQSWLPHREPAEITVMHGGPQVRAAAWTTHSAPLALYWIARALETELRQLPPSASAPASSAAKEADQGKLEGKIQRSNAQRGEDPNESAA